LGKTASAFFGMKAQSLPEFCWHLQRCIFLDSLDSATNMSFTPSSVYLVVMGVAGCGKSSLGAALAQAEGLPLIEGDDHHSPASREKMRQGIALTDADREGWLSTLGQLLQARPQGVVLTCSALKKMYRDRLRDACPGLRFVFLEIDRPHAGQRVAARAGTHFFSSALVDSQFATLESPLGEAGVLRLDALLDLTTLQQQASAWLATKETA
jgi:gluconokinase